MYLIFAMYNYSSRIPVDYYIVLGFVEGGMYSPFIYFLALNPKVHVEVRPYSLVSTPHSFPYISVRFLFDAQSFNIIDTL